MKGKEPSQIQFASRGRDQFGTKFKGQDDITGCRHLDVAGVHLL